MISRRLLVSAFSWAVVTGVATAISWSGISLVTSEVTRDHRSLPASELADTAAPPVPTTAAPPAAPTATAAPVPAPTAPVTAPPAPAAPAPPAPTAAPPSTTVPPRATVTPAPPAPAPAPVAATYATPGGMASVACTADTISLTGARPTDGFRLVVRSAGPERVAVEFLSPTTAFRLLVDCIDGRPVRLPYDGDRHRRPPDDGYRDGDPVGR